MTTLKIKLKSALFYGIVFTAIIFISFGLYEGFHALRNNGYIGDSTYRFYNNFFDIFGAIYGFVGISVSAIITAILKIIIQGLLPDSWLSAMQWNYVVIPISIFISYGLIGFWLGFLKTKLMGIGINQTDDKPKRKRLYYFLVFVTFGAVAFITFLVLIFARLSLSP